VKTKWLRLHKHTPSFKKRRRLSNNLKLTAIILVAVCIATSLTTEYFPIWKVFAATQTCNAATLLELQNCAYTNTPGAAGDTVNINVTANFEISSSIFFRGERIFNLTSSGATRTLTRASGFTGNLIGAYTNHVVNLTMSNIIFDGGGSSRPSSGSIMTATAGSAINLNSGVIFRNNYRADSYSGAGLIIQGTGTTANLTGVTITGNQNSNSAGGGIYVTENNTLNIKGNTTINNNSANSGGGFFASGTVNISGTGNNISKNNSTSAGGAIYIKNTSKTSITGSATFSENTSGNSGGAINVESGGEITMSGVTMSNNTANSSGGAISISGTVTLSNTNAFNGNKATNNLGGAIYVFDSGKLITQSGSNNTFSSNTAGSSGGAIATSGTVNLSAGANNITNNQSASNGGGIYVFTSGSLTTANGTNIKQNKITNTIGSGSFGGGVAIQGTFNMSGGDISENSVANGNGGGVSVSNGGKFYMTGGAISKNTVNDIDPSNDATDGRSGTGGGVAINGTGAEFVMSGGTIGGNSAASANNAQNAGGGVYAWNSGSFTMNGGYIKYNKSDGDAGGIGIGRLIGTLTPGAITLNGGEITNNTAAIYGGGAYNTGGNNSSLIGNLIIPSGSTIKISNNSASAGGGIFLDGSTYNSTTICGGTITGNTASDYGNGILFGGGSTSSKLTICGKPIIGNSDTDNGIYLNYTDTVLTLNGDLQSGSRINIESTHTINKVIANKFDSAGATATTATKPESKYFYYRAGQSLTPKTVVIPSGANYILSNNNPLPAAVTPNHGPSAGGAKITITGTNLDEVNSVTVGGGACASLTVTATTITCNTPAHNPGLVDIIVSNSNDSTTLTNAFEYEIPVTITGVTPNHGPSAGGTNVTITGNNFGNAPPSSTNIINYDTCGSYKTFTAPTAAVYKLETWGAQGGTPSDRTGGKGGYSVGNINLTTGDTLYIYVGCAGSTGSTGGWNGGGGAAPTTSSGTGGGATDIRLVNNTDPLDPTSLQSRIIVAGGGAGSGQDSCATASTGYGGGLTGGGGIAQSNCGTQAGGGTQNSGGSGGVYSTTTGAAGQFGIGGTALDDQYDGGGGGGGWYGGGAGATAYYSNAGGGGSGYVLTENSDKIGYDKNIPSNKYYLINATTIAGNQTITDPDGTSVTGHAGNGYARITYELSPVQFGNSSADYSNCQVTSWSNTQIVCATSAHAKGLVGVKVTLNQYSSATKTAAYTFEPTLNISFASDPLSSCSPSPTPAVNFGTLTPRPSGSIATAACTLLVTTDNTTGYKLSISAGNNYLTSTTNPTNKITPSAGTPAIPITLAPNTWGFALPTANVLSSDGVTTLHSTTGQIASGFNSAYTKITDGDLSAAPAKDYKFAAVPAQPLAIKQTTAPSSNDPTTTFFGAAINYQTLAGNYTTTVIYTVEYNN
jgi:predicted outer membrane repeat protein